MQKSIQNKVAIFFAILFMAVISAPSIIMSIDDSIDITFFYGENEEEEKENLKLLFEISSLSLEDLVISTNDFNATIYTFKSYPKPSLNLVLPPPEFIS